MPQSQKGKKSRSNGGKASRSSLVRLSKPPMIHPAISVSKVIRFQSNAAGGPTAITVANILNTLVVALSATTTSRLVQSFRLRRVSAWSIGAQNAASEIITIAGFGVGPENRAEDASIGVEPAHVEWKPKKGAFNDLWQQTGYNEAQSLFVITFPNSCVVDVLLDLILVCDDTSTAGPVPAGASAGFLYCTNLDGLGNKLVAVDWPQLP